MSQNLNNKEALFNEVKGSLFEYLMALKISRLAACELDFLQSLDKNYLNVLSQQDRMVRQFYPEMLVFLDQVSETSTSELIKYLGEIPKKSVLRGKFETQSEADLMLITSMGEVPLSLKLNKKNSFVNTKSGGIKSFFSHYFAFLSPQIQSEFNRTVDQEFSRMAHELHALNDMDFSGNFSSWVSRGKSELPGELAPNERAVLKAFYARIAIRMHEILSDAQVSCARDFSAALPALMGFSNPRILQLVCFHDFKLGGASSIAIHAFSEVEDSLKSVKILPFNQTSSVELSLGDWALQVRVKPMNKFTTTAIKINCSVKFKPSADL